MRGNRRANGMLIIAGLLLTLAVSASADAQLTGTLTFDISISSTYFDGCDPGIPCLVVFCGVFSGTLTMEYVNFDGVYDNYDVTAVDWLLHRGSCPANASLPAEPVNGTGTFRIDRASLPTMEMSLDLTRPFGPPITVHSGPITPFVPFPVFSGFELVSHPTSETFTMHATLAAAPNFLRGDVNADGSINLADAVAALNSLFGTNPSTPTCEDAHDVNDDGQRNLGDPIYLLNTLFVAGTPNPPAPFPSCGVDPTNDALTCTSFAACP